MYDENDLIFSPLQRTLTQDDRWVKVCIYRMPDSQWTLEVEDDKGGSTVWDNPFESDQAALDVALAEIRAFGLLNLMVMPRDICYTVPEPERGKSTVHLHDEEV